MPSRYTPLVNGEYYHIYNRGSARLPVFLNKKDYERFIIALSYYRFLNPAVKLSRFLLFSQKRRKAYLFSLEEGGKKLVEIISFVLLTNHFHLLLKQISDNGISTYMRLAINSWTRYFNTKHNRPGALFQGAFKAVRVESDEQLLHLSRYIHLNPLVTYVVKEKDFLSYPWSSLSDYLKGKSSLIDIEPVLAHFSSPDAYRKFILDYADYAKELGKIKYLMMEKD